MVKKWLNIDLWNGLCKPWLSLIQLRISRVILAGATSKIKLLVFDEKHEKHGSRGKAGGRAEDQDIPLTYDFESGNRPNGSCPRHCI